MSSVIEMLGHSSISETILGLMFLSKSSVAQVCLRSWKRILRSFARSRSDAKERCLRLVGFTRVPLSVAKTSPSSL